MAYDLLLGQTKRDWSCGEAIPPPSPPMPTPASSLAEATSREIAASAKLAIKLARAKRLPEADRIAFRRFHRAWVAWSDAKGRRFKPSDELKLEEWRAINGGFGKRLKAFEEIARAAIEREQKALVPFRPEGSSAGTEGRRTWPYVLATGLALAGIGTFASKLR